MRLSLALILFAWGPVASAFATQSGCDELRSFAALARLGHDSEASRALALARQIFCLRAIEPGKPVYYPNGKILTEAAGANRGPLYYDNGQVITAETMNTEGAWYYPNGQVISYAGLAYGASWWYSDGNIATYAALLPGVKWYWPNGQFITTNASAISVWSYECGRPISPYFGKPHVVWYRQDGSVLLEDAPALSAAELSEPPLLLLKLGI